MFKKIAFIAFIIILSGLSAITADRFFFPYFSTTKFFSRYDFLKRSIEDVTVINKTEQIYVQETSTISKTINQVASSVVSITSYQPAALKISKSAIEISPKIGTGIIVTSDGIIMTYSSAVDTSNSKYKIMTADGNSYDAELIGVDSYSNLAFLKVVASNLPVVSFLNSDEIKPGEKIIAIGNGLGKYPNKFSSGLLSSFDPMYNLSGKALSISEKLEGVFETDANLEYDYVGGPIIDYSGQVIGITGSIDKDGKTGFFQIPGNKIKTALDKAIKKELDTNPVLGIYYIPLTKSYALANNMQTEQGALIHSSSGQNGLAVISGTPAAKAGLKIEDVIIAINEDRVTLESSLPDLLYKHKKGEEIELTIIRDGTEIKEKIQL